MHRQASCTVATTRALGAWGGAGPVPCLPTTQRQADLHVLQRRRLARRGKPLYCWIYASCGCLDGLPRTPHGCSNKGVGAMVWGRTCSLPARYPTTSRCSAIFISNHRFDLKPESQCLPTTQVHVDAVVPPPRPSTVPAALQQTMPLADVLNLISKPPGSAPPFIPYKPVPHLVPLPLK